jgi:hypothetical protein
MFGRNNYINSKKILYCILTVLTVTQILISNMQVETYATHVQESSLNKVNS